MKHAIVILSDPKGGEEALGRAFNGLAFAADAARAGDEVQVLFAGAGTRWPSELTKLGHPAGKLYQAVRPLVRGASCGCSEVFGAKSEKDPSSDVGRAFLSAIRSETEPRVLESMLRAASAGGRRHAAFPPSGASGPSRCIARRAGRAPVLPLQR